MSERRKVLGGMVKLMGVGVIVFFVYIFVRAIFGTTGDQYREQIILELPALSPGQMQYLQVQGRELMVLHRDNRMKQALSQFNNGLYDAASQTIEENLSDWFVAYALDPLFGCRLELSESRLFFQAQCSPQKYDLAGRPYKGQQSQLPLRIPEYEIRGGKIWLSVY